MERLVVLKKMTADMVGLYMHVDNCITQRDDITWVEVANLAKCVTNTLTTISRAEIDRVSQLVAAALQT